MANSHHYFSNGRFYISSLNAEPKFTIFLSFGQVELLKFAVHIFHYEKHNTHTPLVLFFQHRCQFAKYNW